MLDAAVDPLPMPPLWWTLSDVARASAEAVGWEVVRRVLPVTRRGADRPVLVLPGFGCGDLTTRTLRRHLRDRGFHAHGWRLGVNRGFTDDILDGVVERLRELRARHGRPVAVVGWSLGGLMARWLAHSFPDDVERIVCLGSPFRAEGERNRVTFAFRAAERRFGFSARTDDVIELLRRPVPVPSAAIFSPMDGFVHRESCRQDPGEACDNIVVPGSHCGLGHNPAALIAVTDRLEVPLASWRPFRWADALAGGVGLGAAVPITVPHRGRAPLAA